MILFSDIYKKAFKLFDDPKITYAYEHNKIVFAKYMYGYLSTVSIQEPLIISQALSDVIEPKGELEVWEADGVNKEFDYTLTIPEDSEINCTQGGKIVNAIIDKENKRITFPDVLQAGQEYALEYYFPGAYKTNFGGITSVAASQKDIALKVTNILSRLIIIAWAEETQNMLVDIQGLLKDTDFKASDNDKILASKVEWINALLYRNHADQVKLAWQLRYSSNVPKFKKR